MVDDKMLQQLSAAAHLNLNLKNNKDVVREQIIRQQPKYIEIQIINRTMDKSSEIKKQNNKTNFVKGMTLSEYLINFPALLLTDRKSNVNQKQKKNQQSSHCSLRMRIMPKTTQLQIQEIGQVSIQDSMQLEKPQKTIATPSFGQQQQLNQKPKVPSKQSNLASSGFKLSLSSHSSLNKRQYSQRKSFDKNSFRGKKISISSLKQISDDLMSSYSITLQKSKIEQTLKKEQCKMPEIVTFYGKLSNNQDQSKMKKKASLNNGDIKQNFRKKNQLQIKELVMFQKKIKSIKNLRTNNREKKPTGVNEKLKERNLQKQ